MSVNAFVQLYPPGLRRVGQPCGYLGGGSSVPSKQYTEPASVVWVALAGMRVSLYLDEVKCFLHSVDVVKSSMLCSELQR